MKKILLVALFLLPAVTSYGQVNSATIILWDQYAPDDSTVNQYIYRFYLDTAPMGTILPAYCQGSASPFLCSSKIPNLDSNPGPHVFTLTAGNTAGESDKSAAVTFNYQIVPSAPQQPRLANPTTAAAAKQGTTNPSNPNKAGAAAAPKPLAPPSPPLPPTGGNVPTVPGSPQTTTPAKK